MTDWDDMPPLEDDDGAATHPGTGAIRLLSQNGLDQSDCSDDNEDLWEEMEEESNQIKTKCLFCEDKTLTIQTCWTHIKDVHNFDFSAFVCGLDLDQIEFIKLINFVRIEKPSPSELKAMDKITWNCDTYMKPTFEDDALLMYDIEDFALSENSHMKNKDREIETLKATVEGLQEIVDKQRETMQRMLQAAQANSENQQRPSVRTVSCIRPEEDEGYFNSYAHFDIHHEMLSDRVRTESYRDAILGNSVLLSKKRVLDLGCGTGILSMFSAKAGASVNGVDMSDVIYQAIDIVRENKLETCISLQKGRLEDMEFKDKFDFIVSEWMGYFLLFEGMLDSVLYARDHHLAKGGLLLPNRCTMHIIGMDDLKSYNKFIAFWDDVYGFKMSCMRGGVIKEATTEVVKEECIITSADKIADFDLMTIQPEDTEFVSEFSVIVKRDGQLTGLVGYFDTYFELPNPIFFSTGPCATPTHWKQTIFYQPHPIPVKKGEVLKGVISVQRKRREIRSLDVKIKFADKTLSYVVE